MSNTRRDQVQTQLHWYQFNPNDHHACTTSKGNPKKRYPNKKTARSDIRRITTNTAYNNRHGYELRDYKCPVCRHIHIGHRRVNA